MARIYTSLCEQRDPELISLRGSTPINRRDVKISRRVERITVKLHMVSVPLSLGAKVTDESPTFRARG